MRKPISFWTRNLLGAFSDGAVLFPLVAAMSLKSGFNGAVLLGSAGVAYIVSAVVFRIPMPVQPLKSIAIASVAIGASAVEVRWSGFLLGLFCLGLGLLPIDRIARKVPEALIHSLQLGLGLLLLSQAWKFDHSLLVVLSAGALVLADSRASIPLLGIVATFGLIWALIVGGSGEPASASLTASTARSGIIAGLVLPQIALTLGNSVLGTEQVARRYFGLEARRVTVRRILSSIGIGNVISGMAGGLPYCHGSGGLTAHVRGGASHWIAGTLMGGTLMIFASIHAWSGSLTLSYPPQLLSCLLGATGFFHLKLAAPTWNASGAQDVVGYFASFGRAKLAGSAMAAIATQSMLWVLASAIAFEVIERVILGNSREETGCA